MVVATTSGDYTEKFELKSAPGGFVVLRRLTYGEYLQRRQMSSNMKIEGGKQKSFSGIMELVNRKTTEYEFANCIVEHNLTDENGKELNFKLASTIQSLDPRVGEEISTRIGELNNFEEEEEDELGNSLDD